MLGVLTQGLLDVCEGQSLDLEFEGRTDVSVKEYFRMIGKKTGSLIAAATELGGLVGGGTRSAGGRAPPVRPRLGRAFQVQDDLLDVVGDPDDFGKTIGGDILEGKEDVPPAEGGGARRGGRRGADRPRARKGKAFPRVEEGGRFRHAGRSRARRRR
jgi:geranylgeranyl pyrophosphate synthase